MIITSKISMDLVKQPWQNPVSVVQEDRYSRNLEISLFSEGVPWPVPEGAAVRIRYSKTDGKGGEYDALPDGTGAWSAEENVLTIALAPQVMTVPGPVDLMVSINLKEKQISTFGIRLHVHRKVSGELEDSETYHYVTAFLPTPGTAKEGQFLRIAGVDENETVTAVEAVSTEEFAGTTPEEARTIAQECVEEILMTEVTVADTEYQGFYMNGKGRFVAATSNFKIYQVPVMKGESYRVVYPGHSSLSAAYGAIGFSEEAPAANGAVENLLYCTTTATDIDFAYIATADGYLNVFASNVSSRPQFTVTRKAFRDYHSVVTEALKIQLFGDSLTDNLYGDKRTWANYIAEYIPERIVTVVNSAVGGSSIGHGSCIGNTESQQDKAYNSVWDLVTGGNDGASLALETDSDVIVILAGTNDWAGAAKEIGSFGDSTYNTLYGCLKQIIEYISANTEAKLFLCTIPQRYHSEDQAFSVNEKGEPVNSLGYSLRDYCEPYVEMAQFYGVPCIDLNRDLGWNRVNVSKFCGDGLHPNELGDRWIARLICNEIKKHMVV